MKFYFSAPEDFRSKFKSILKFYGINAEHIKVNEEGQYNPNQSFYIVAETDVPNDYWKKTGKQFKNILDLSGTYLQERYLPHRFKRITCADICLEYNQKYFRHRKKLTEIINENISIPEIDYQGEILIHDNKTGLPLLIHEKNIHGAEVIYSTVNLLDKKNKISIFDLSHVDWIWSSIETICKKPLLHNQWSKLLSLRVDDVIGDASFDFTETLGNLANKTLLAVDVQYIRKRFFEDYLPKCGEVCIHALTHYKYVKREETVLMYMEWDQEKEYASDKLKHFFRIYDNFFENIPENKIARVLSPHAFQVGEKSLGYLKKRNIDYLIMPFAPGDSFSSEKHNTFNAFPYNNMNFHFSKYGNQYLFFHSYIKKSFNSWLGFRNYKLNEQESSCSDFLFDLKLFKAPDKYLNPVSQIIKRIEKVRELSAIAGFPLVLFTHETSINYLGYDGWKQISNYIENNLIGEYKQSKLSDTLCAMTNTIN